MDSNSTESKLKVTLQNIDPLFRVEVLNKSPNPNKLIYQALHQDYSETFVYDDPTPDESKCGQIAVQRLLNGGRGHYGCLENPQISFNVGYFPHSCMQQMRTHRTGISFDVQSFRYSGTRIYDLAVLASGVNFGDEEKTENFLPEIEKIFYVRPVGFYTDRQGKKYETSYDQREEDLLFCLHAARRYRDRINQGYSEEHARSTIPFDVRQHFVMSCNLRTALHLLDLRAKENAQLECRQLCDLIIPHLKEWVPEITDWYIKNRLGKARLSP